MSVELSKQKLALDEAVREIHKRIIDYQDWEKILLAGIKALDDGENVLEGHGFLATEVRSIMYKFKNKI
jgi:hypothetical protein